MFKLYQVVNGKARFCGYDANNKRSLVAKAITLPSGLGKRLPLHWSSNRPLAYAEGRYYN